MSAAVETTEGGIVAIAHEGKVTMGGDALVGGGWHYETLGHPKVFERGPFLFGIAGDAVVYQVLRYHFKVPDHPDGTDDAQLSIALLDAAGKPVSAAVPVTLTVVSGPGEFPTGRSITFSPPGRGDASDIFIRDGQAAIAFRSYHAGESVIRARSPGLPDATLTLKTAGAPAFVPGRTPLAPDRPYARHVARPAAGAVATDAKTPAGGDVLALNRPTQASSAAAGAPSALANDGDPASAWRAAAATDQSFEVFLEVAYDVERITLVFPREAKHRYHIDVSADGVSWREVVKPSAPEGAALRRTHEGDFGRGIVRVRVRFTVPPGGPLPELAEIQVGGRGRT